MAERGSRKVATRLVDQTKRGWRSCVSGLLTMTVLAQVAAAEPFRLGVINERPDRPSFALEQYAPLEAYLHARLAERGFATTGEVVITRDLDEMSSRVETGAVQAVLEGVMPTLKLRQRTGRLDVRLLLWRKGQRQYHTVFFARRDSMIERLDQLRGKTIVFESPRSTSAYDVPRLALIEAGLNLVSAVGNGVSDGHSPRDVRFVFAGSELNQAYWVHAGRADAGAFNDGDWERVPKTIQSELRIFHETPPILRWLLSFTAVVDPDVRDAAVEILLSMDKDPEGRAVLQAASRIAKIERLTDADRASLTYWEQALRRLGSMAIE
ncbi:phosphate/phosphite/phosphonate ABC transporter substrate-binding protein [Thiorhodococcus minor]|uniref:Phosphate/phosphite/phosphonate ABC transporter substrate-binding protein n=1 Tax=Thiorhodococcus minor TaxID=57489 RepID=A0A6M0K3H0_9GAMM|nr:phosphate/phosphite/phosphonate ABC transporter substrate-binding protein [Thiorhodococcus minor]NEV64348.1 phosphate/phosphite/phosphonate ABC transporter substrate-binding protein [Thiorhodococcus minor]